MIRECLLNDFDAVTSPGRAKVSSEERIIVCGGARKPFPLEAYVKERQTSRGESVLSIPG